MPEIQVLSAHVADLIAAGEVVERPASVVKELTENAIDAGAHTVTVEIQRGGMALIRVTDDGCGIPAAQCRTAFLRHATSKLRTPEDLAAIGTLGFRGEALAAISAVSRVELFTRTAEEDLGAALTLEGGQVLEEERTGCPLGTTLVVRDLFFNTPARLKFMKRDAAEGAAVFAVVQRLALSHPEVSLKFLRDGKQELHTPGDGKRESVLYAVFGRDIALGFTPVDGGGGDVAVSGFVTMPACCRGSRSYQHFFVNGRQVKSKLLTAALEKAYENQKMVGKFPGCVLEIGIKPSAVDVNVHPAKTEVKFLSERTVFDGVYYAVLSALTGEDRHPALTFRKPAPGPARAPGGAFQRMTAEEYRKTRTLRDGAFDLLRPLARESAAPPPFVPNPVPSSPSASVTADDRSPERRQAQRAAVEKPVENVEKQRKTEASPRAFPAGEPAPVWEEQTLPLPPAEPESGPEPDPVPVLETPLEPPAWRLAGEVLDTYLIVERGDEILFIDKHAAHERMNFDRMKRAEYRPMVQTLLVPEVFTPSPEEGAVLLEHRDLLSRFGFACDDFGGGSLAVREIPDYLEPGQTGAALCELAGVLLSGASADPESARDAVLHTMACKAAVKGGQKNSREELLIVARAVLSGEVKYCPHGRPVAVTMTRKELEKQFGRIQ